MSRKTPSPAERIAVRAAERGLSRDEQKLWRRVVRTVDPLPGRDAALRELEAALDQQGVSHDPRPPRPIRGRSAPKTVETQAKPASPDPADRSAEKRVRRGRITLGGRLDLHGHTQDGAFHALLRFVETSRAHGARSVLVITGKGRAGEGVLRRRFGDWLAHPACRQHVSGFAQAHAKHVGSGAVYVFLKPPQACETPFR